MERHSMSFQGSIVNNASNDSFDVQAHEIDEDRAAQERIEE